MQICRSLHGEVRFYGCSLCRQHRLICGILDIRFVNLNKSASETDARRKRSVHGVESREKRIGAVWRRITQACNIVGAIAGAKELNSNRLGQMVVVNRSVEIITE